MFKKSEQYFHFSSVLNAIFHNIVKLKYYTLDFYKIGKYMKFHEPISTLIWNFKFDKKQISQITNNSGLKIRENYFALKIVFIPKSIHITLKKKLIISDISQANI